MLFSQQNFCRRFNSSLFAFLVCPPLALSQQAIAQTPESLVCDTDATTEVITQESDPDDGLGLLAGIQLGDDPEKIEFGSLAIEDIQLEVYSANGRADLRRETNQNVLDKLDELDLPDTMRLPSAAIAQLEQDTGNNIYKIEDSVAYADPSLDEESRDEAFDFNQLREQLLAIYIEEGFLLNEVEPVIYLEEISNPVNEDRKFQLIIVVRQPSIGRLYYRFPEIEEGNQQDEVFNQEIFCDRLLDAIGGLNQPIDYDAIQNNLIYLRNDPNINNIEAYIKKTDGNDGLLELEVLIAEEQSDQVQIVFENTTPESVGDYKYGISYANTNLSRFGDRLNFGYTGTTTGGVRAYNISYQTPLDNRDKTLTFNFSPSWTRITNEPFDEFNIKSRTQFFSVEYNHPLIRRLDEEFAFSLGFEFQNGQSFIFNDIPTAFGNGVNDQGITRTSTFTFRQNYISRSTQGAWLLDSKFSFGSGLFGATTNRWNEPGGFFNKWEGYIQRLQKLSENHSLLLQAKIQVTPKTLASSQQFFIGGMNTVRGYRANARTADNGVRFSLEDYITLRSNDTGDPTILMIPFVDLGYVWNNPSTSNGLNQPQFLSSVGMGLQFNDLFGTEDLTAKVYWAHPFTELKDRGNSLQDDGIYFSLGYTFNNF